MTGIVLFSAGQEDAHQTYLRSVKRGHDPNEISQYLHNELVETATDSSSNNIHVWGTSIESKWQSVEAGDIALVYRDGSYRAQATVVATKHNPELAEHLCLTGDESQKSETDRRFLTFLVGIEEINIDIAEFNALVDYEDNYIPKGFTRVADNRVEALKDQYGAVETAINELTGDGVRVYDLDVENETRPDTPTHKPSSVLVLESSTDSSEPVCTSLLSVGEPENTHLLSVTFDGTPDELVDSWRDRNGLPPARTGVVTVGDTTRSAATSAPSGPGSTPVTIDTVPDPSDLTGLGMALSCYLEAWAETDATLVVCFHSISSLLLHADEERVFRFLHTMIGRMRAIGAYAHFHLDLTAHSETTVTLISSLFDANLRIENDGSVAVHRNR